MADPIQLQNHVGTKPPLNAATIITKHMAMDTANVLRNVTWGFHENDHAISQGDGCPKLRNDSEPKHPDKHGSDMGSAS